MGLRINTNIDALMAHRNLSNTTESLSRSMARLSSGLRINSAADDAAGLGISERMRAQINGVKQAQRNAQDGISLVQTAEGALNEIQAILHRVRDLAVQFNNGVYDDGSRAAITAEVAQLSAELSRILGSAEFNGIALLSGDAVASPVMVTLQVGANDNATITIATIALNSTLGNAVEQFASTTTSTAINLAALDTVIERVTNARSSLGSVQNRLEHAINFLGSYEENLMAAESRIRDVDMAAEMTNMTRLQILQQSGTAMLAQANQSQQSVLSLLQ
jgi:flagellin